MPGPDARPRTFATTFDEALTASGITVAELRSRLEARGHKVAPSTLGYWRSGQRQPERAESLDAVAEIEALLRVQPGSLLRAIGASRRTGPPIPQADVSDLPSMPPAMTEALAWLELDSLRPGHIEEALDITADFDRHGHWARMTTRSRLRATTDCVSRSTAYCLGPPESTPDDFTFDVGGRLGRTVCLPEHGIFLAELLLERPLDAGETAMVEYSFTFSGEDDPDFGTFAPNRMSHVSVWARFSPERTPRRAWRYTQRVGYDDELTQVDIKGTTSLHHALRGFGPGLMGVRWEW